MGEECTGPEKLGLAPNFLQQGFLLCETFCRTLMQNPKGSAEFLGKLWEPGVPWARLLRTGFFSATGRHSCRRPRLLSSTRQRQDMNVRKFCPLPQSTLIGNFCMYLYIASLVVILSNWVCDTWVYQFPSQALGRRQDCSQHAPHWDLVPNP